MEELNRAQMISPIKGQAGQGVIEYLLVLIVTVGLLLLLKQFFKPFDDFVQNYYGNYLACMLETGELPWTHDGECEQEYKPFNASISKQLAQNGRNGAGQNNQDQQGQDSGSGGRNGNQGNSGAAAGGRFGSRGGLFARGGRGGGGASAGSAGQAPAGGGQGDYTGSTAVSSRKVTVDNSRQPKFSQQLDSKFFRIADEQDDKGRKPTSVAQKGRFLNGRPTKFSQAVKPPQPMKESTNGGWDLGFLLRFFLIAAILIALFVLVGGQALQLSKSWEK